MADSRTTLLTGASNRDAAVGGDSSESTDEREQATAWVERMLPEIERRVAGQRRPRSTYRLQFHGGFTFRDAAALIDYFHSLGVGEIYASPYLRSRQGSRHGYDIVDPTQLNLEIGGEQELAEFVAKLRSRDMGQILDIVPNHMGVGSDENPWWQDVLENGPSSPFADCFDIDWNPLKPDLKNKVLLPVLADQFGLVLEDEQLQLHYGEGAFWIEYYGRRFPLAPRSYAVVLRHRIEQLSQRLGGDDVPAFLEYESILTAIGNLPPQDVRDPEEVRTRHREKEVIKRRLARLCEETPEVETFLGENLLEINGRRGDPASFDLLEALLADQAYRLSDWRVAADEINYRRFFDVNELAAVCMERPEVFQQWHELVLRLIDDGYIDGLRIDHADGLFDPTAYLWQLQQMRYLKHGRRVWDSQPESEKAVDWELVEEQLRLGFAQRCQSGPSAWNPLPLFVVVEKILERDENLPANWPVAGTSGYDFLNLLNALFVDSRGRAAMDALYQKFIGQKVRFEDLVYESKRLIQRVSMSSELALLSHQLDRLSERHRRSRDFTQNGLTLAIREVVACFPVYRTYTAAAGDVQPRDRHYIEMAVARAKRRNPAVSTALFDFVRSILLLEGIDQFSHEDREEHLQFVERFQQFTGPMMAKAVEDTAFYRYHRLISLNEVGGDPTSFGSSVEHFHRQNIRRRETHPYSLLATSTHDTKRSEDVRARINVLSEIPSAWRTRVFRWTRWNKRYKTPVDGEAAPNRNDEYLLYQTLLGTWPGDLADGDLRTEFRQRIEQYMLKAVREAKTHSSWVAPDEAYEHALKTFIGALLRERPQSAFLTDFQPFAQQIADAGMWNSLAQTLLKLASPGVPDTYQGTELWDLSLVDPDNRRLVDYGVRARHLSWLDEQLAAGIDPPDRAALADTLVAAARDGRIKLLVTAQVLRLRRRCPDLMTVGDYVPLSAHGGRADHVCGFIRRTEDAMIVAVAPRLTATLVGEIGQPPLGQAVWHDTHVVLPDEWSDGSWQDLFTGQVLRTSPGARTLQLAELLARFPLSLLVKQTG